MCQKKRARIFLRVFLATLKRPQRLRSETVPRPSTTSSVAASSEDPYGLSKEIKKEEESSEEDPEGFPRGQPSVSFQEAREYAP